MGLTAKIKERIHRLLWAGTSVFYRGLKYKHDETVVFLPFFGRLGDMVMFLDALEGWKELIINRQKKRLVLGCRKEVWALLQSAGADQGIEYIELTREKLNQSYAYFTDRIRQTRALRAGKLINVRDNSAIEHVFLYAIGIPDSVVYRSFEIEQSNRMQRFFSTRTYQTEMRPETEMDQLTCYADMLRRSGLSSFSSKIPELPPVGERSRKINGDYVCVCPGASVENKCWPVERYAKVLDHIAERTHFSIVFSGGKGDRNISEKIISKMEHRDMVVDLTGETSLSEWIATIREARFVVTNESGSVHIAAASKVQAICIGEQKFSNKWLPYRPEVIRAEDRNPIIIRGPRLSCEFCVKRGFRRSSECKKCYEEHGTVKCVYDVKLDDVIRAVDKLIDTL